MPTPTIRVNGPRAKNWSTGMVFVDADDVQEVVDAIHLSVSPPGIVSFFVGYVSPYFEDQIVDTFAGHGQAGVPGGSWPPLTEATLRIRHGMGFMDDEAWNERSGDLLDYVVHSRAYDYIPDGAEMQIPADTGNPELARKLRVAQEGTLQNPLIPGAFTPPRPVLAIDETDAAAVMKMLQTHIQIFASRKLRAIGTVMP